MNRKHLGLVGVVLAGLLAPMFFAPADVDIVSGATKKKPTKKKTSTRKTSRARAAAEYFYLVVQSDGASEIKTMTLVEAKAHRGDMLKDLAHLKKERREFLKVWNRSPDAGSCPVPPPRMYKCQRLAQASSKDAARARQRKKYDRVLNQWSICTTTDHTGESQTVVLRRDQVLGVRLGQLKEYAEALIAARGDSEAATAIKKPTFKIVRSKLPSEGAAQRALEILKAATAAAAG